MHFCCDKFVHSVHILESPLPNDSRMTRSQSRGKSQARSDMKRIIGVLALTTALTACSTPAPIQTLSRIALTCVSNSVVVAATTTCSAVAKDSSGTNLATQPVFTFVSSDITKVTVSSAGVVTGEAAGVSSITAQFRAVGITISNAVVITVTNPNAKSRGAD